MYSQRFGTVQREVRGPTPRVVVVVSASEMGGSLVRGPCPPPLWPRLVCIWKISIWISGASCRLVMGSGCGRRGPGLGPGLARGQLADDLGPGCAPGKLGRGGVVGGLESLPGQLHR